MWYRRQVKWMDEVLGACRGFWEKLSGFDALE